MKFPIDYSVRIPALLPAQLKQYHPSQKFHDCTEAHSGFIAGSIETITDNAVVNQLSTAHSGFIAGSIETLYCDIAKGNKDKGAFRLYCRLN